MLNLINRFYRKDTVTNDIIDALQIKADDVEAKINDLYKQIFLAYADWYLEYKEAEMGLEVKAEDEDARRARIKTRLLGVGTATKEMLEGVASSIEGTEVEILYDCDNMTVTINYLEVASNKYINIVKKAIAEMIPYHLDLLIIYPKIMWEEFTEVTWGDVAEYTWGSIKESVAGTIGKGLDDSFD